MMQFDRAQLAACGLSLYLRDGCRCGGDTVYHIVAVRSANGVWQYRLRCTTCDRLCGSAILHSLIAPHMIAAELDVYIKPENKCERCGEWENGVERHHWAPAAVFADFDQWPTALLCSRCHTEWHIKMTGYLWAPPTSRRSSNR